MQGPKKGAVADSSDFHDRLNRGISLLHLRTKKTKERMSVITEGTAAPGFSLNDQFGRKISLEDFRDRRHILLVFYPLDWTPT